MPHEYYHMLTHDLLDVLVSGNNELLLAKFFELIATIGHSTICQIEMNNNLHNTISIINTFENMNQHLTYTSNLLDEEVNIPAHYSSRDVQLFHNMKLRHLGAVSEQVIRQGLLSAFRN